MKDSDKTNNNQTKDFTGFPETSFEFLSALEKNNNRKWLIRYKKEYNTCIILPARQFVSVLGTKLKSLSGDIHCIPRSDGPGSILKLYKGLQYSKADNPYFTSFRIYFWEGEDKIKLRNPGFFFRFGPEKGEMYAGIHKFNRVLLQAYRDTVVHDELGAELFKLLEKIKNIPEYTVESRNVKKVPKLFDKDHPRNELLLYNGVWIRGPVLSREEMCRGSMIDTCFSFCKDVYPLHSWFVTLSASTAELIKKYR